MRWKDALIVVSASTLICLGLRSIFIELGVTEVWDFLGRLATAAWVTNLLIDLTIKNRQAIH